MTPERREAIRQALIREDQDWYIARMGGDVGMADEDFDSDITEERIEAYDRWLQEFPS